MKTQGEGAPIRSLSGGNVQRAGQASQQAALQASWDDRARQAEDYIRSGERAREVVLFALDAKRIARDIADFRQVEIYYVTTLAVTPVVHRCFEPALDQQRGDRDLVEHFQR